MPKGRHSALSIVNTWFTMTPSLEERYWAKTSECVKHLKELHSPGVMPLTLPSRTKICVQSLRIVEWILSLLDEPDASSKYAEDIPTFADKLLPILQLLLEVMKPLNTTLLSDIPNIVVLRKVIRHPQLSKLKDICVDIICIFIHDDPNVVLATIAEYRAAPYAHRNPAASEAFLARRKDGKRHKESRQILRSARKEKIFLEADPDSPISYFGEGCMSMGRQAKDTPSPLAPLVNLQPGDLVEASPLQRLMCVLPASAKHRATDQPIELSAVHTEHLLANLVALLNAPDRQWQGSVLAVGLCPASRRAVGVSMNYNDQDSFRIGFDSTVVRRIRPCPTADCFRLHFLPLQGKGAEGPTTREEVERLQKLRRPTLIVVEVQKILCAELFAFEDFDAKNRKAVLVKTVPQGDSIRVLDRVNDLRTVAAQSVACRLRRELEEVDQELANLDHP